MKRSSLAALLLTVISGTALAQEPGGNLPFTNIYQRPAVSPYTMLGNTVAGGMATNPTANPLVYIQPRFDQESQIVGGMQQARQINNLQNRVQQIQRDTSSRQVNEGIRATGHSATYLNMSHYYPGAR